MQANGSEIARIRQQIELEHQAATLGLTGLAIVARHEVITRRMEIGAERLLKLIEEGKHEEAQAIMNTPGWGSEDLPDTSTRDTLVDLLRSELDQTEEAAILIERIRTMWETRDLLIARFGAEPARKIIETPSSLLSGSEEVSS